MTSNRRLALLAGAALSLGGAALACSSSVVADDVASDMDAGDDGTLGDDGAASGDGAETDSGGAKDGAAGDGGGAKDGGSGDATLAFDANGPGKTGDTCSFNRDCVIADRCECNGGTCTCKVGVRGTGQNGVDGCDSGNQCASAVCAEGNKGAYYCSGECLTPSDCKTKLPLCEDISFVGRICVRNPDGG